MRLVITYLLFVLIPSIAGLAEANGQTWSLQQCIDTAEAYNKTLQISRAGMELSEQREKEVQAGLFPKVTANAEYKYFGDQPYQLLPLSVFGGPADQFKEAQFGVPHNVNASVQLNLPIYNPQQYGAMHTAEIATERSVLQYRKTEEQVAFEITNLYYNAQILYHQVLFTDSNILSATVLLSTTSLLYEQSLVKITDVDKVRLQLSRLTTQKEILSARYEQVINLLRFNMGVAPDRKIDIDPVIQFVEPLQFVYHPTPDLLLADAQFRLLSGELQALRRSWLPSISLVGMYGYTGFGYRSSANTFLNFYPVSFAGVQLSFPLFNGTVTQRRIRQKKLELHISSVQRDLLAGREAVLIENTRLQRAAARRAITTAGEQISLADEIYDQTLIQHKQGTASLTDVLLADDALREAQQAYLNSVIEYLKADLELKRLTGNKPVVQ